VWVELQVRRNGPSTLHQPTVRRPERARHHFSRIPALPGWT
jgi:hypothetical protein